MDDAVFQAESNGIRVRVRPYYAPDHSVHHRRQYVFIYHITIENLGDATVTLLRRHWYIHDPVGGDGEVEGEGVVGDQPVLAPGDDYEYESYCVLEGPEGHMEGHYTFRRTDGAVFDARIPRFFLRARDAGPALGPF
ncbi:MAG TPA: Co2+/Mg2+ efflux protein ApaG [Longimicrobiales bacterium]